MDFILKLTQNQRELLISAIGGATYRQNYEEHVGMMQALLTIAGKKSNSRYSYLRQAFMIDTFSKKENVLTGRGLNFNGGRVNVTGVNRGKGKEAFPNVPTVQYNGKVWCPETEYGCFVARRNGKVYLTGNTYNEEMKGQAILQLTQIGLQFDESKSDNPFAYFTSAVTNSFVRVINLEKQNQSVRDDLLEMHGLNPSYSRALNFEHAFHERNSAASQQPPAKLP